MFFVILSKYRCFFSTVRQIQINKDNFHFIMIIYICLIFLYSSQFRSLLREARVIDPIYNSALRN